ncbi:hypothetical protein KCU60_g45, partial [Aureobasidium melanogenum]
MAEEHAKLESLYEQGRSMEKGSSHGLSLPWVSQLGIFADELLQTDLPGRPCFIWRKWDDDDEKAANRASILLHTRICLDLADSGGSEQDFVVVWVILVNKLEKDDVRGDGKVDTKQAVGIRLASQ